MRTSLPDGVGGQLQLRVSEYLAQWGTHRFHARRAGLAEHFAAGCLELSRGDVRSGWVKRIASVAGDGSVVVADIHAYPKDLWNGYGAA